MGTAAACSEHVSCGLVEDALVLLHEALDALPHIEQRLALQPVDHGVKVLDHRVLPLDIPSAWRSAVAVVHEVLRDVED
ncbi:hypothetical protein GUITHDRAFT_121612 [Guillardia theta CCMP2712]|uniref:Uncharacterized protein n=1 Tax=Guillardia theta (strain CCMP2712) TaxID=905079 RepID=L1I8K3_GUITC|nr:hypothetical protein GUITHDRAFT_121612 [Guillardia theta CCMP2712]EKX32224.1 hypothetical protein GUITHDRAFT_121612 [Guillardia theta CCMP2712]|eukprot:XP_005819204.1 hypothetical protein GUITHDRAFT_121612 [Guillardia theta CCMP2712]